MTRTRTKLLIPRPLLLAARRRGDRIVMFSQLFTARRRGVRLFI
jgi:hypothetical protein